MKVRHPAAVPLALCYLAVLALLLWARSLAPLFAVAAAIFAIAGGFGALRSAPAPRTRLLHVAAAVLVLVGAGFALAGSIRLRDVPANWPGKLAQREVRLVAELDQQLRALLNRGRRVASLAAGAADRHAGRDLFTQLSALHARADVASLMVFDSAGQLVAWAGEHHGTVPPEVAAGAGPLIFSERPLFSYVYISAPAAERGRQAVAALLLESGWPAEHFHDRGFAGRFAHRVGAQPRFVQQGPASWTLRMGADTVLRARFTPLSQSEWREDVAHRAALGALLAALASLLLLAFAWRRVAQLSATLRGGLPLAALAFAFALTPFELVFREQRLFSPGLFLLPGPFELTLGSVLLAAVPLAVIAAAHRPRYVAPRNVRAFVAIGALAVAIGFPLLLRILLRGAAAPLLEDGFYLWGLLQGLAVLALASLVVLLLPSELPGKPQRRAALIATGAALSILFSVAVLGRWRLLDVFDAWTAVLWAIPFAFLAFGLAPYTGRASLLARWLVAVWLAGTAVVPHLWLAHLEARFEAAERDLATLGTQADPYVAYLLRRFGDEVVLRAETGEQGKELLYRAWLSSGLAGEALPLVLSTWDAAGRQELQLELGERADAAAQPWFTSWLLTQATQSRAPIVHAPENAPGVSQAMAVRIDEGRTVIAVVPPRRALEHSSLLAPLLGDPAKSDAQLTLVPERARAESPHGNVEWRPTDRGWRSETYIHFPEGDQHAHLELRVPPLGVRMARATLLLATDLLVLSLLWLIGRLARGDLPHVPFGALRSFRARVTLALFLFFLLPTAVFGLVAYRSLAGEVERSARVVAERTVELANAAFPDSARDMDALAARVGADVLFYQGGELLAVSSREAVDLGLYDAWLPPAVYLQLESGEEARVSHVRQLGRHPYLFSYARVRPSGTLAVPTSLEIGEAATRQRELAHLILFAALMGGLLSLALSVAVGNALATPIGQLRRAAALVGAGRLGVRLPENRADEFGELFRSFNRMALRLRRARAREKRTARVLAWGEMARQVAHEIKNPLTPIKLSVQHLRRAYVDRRADFERILDTSVQQILAEIDRLTEIARAFSRFGAPPEAAGPLQRVDAAAVARDSLTLYRSSDEEVRYEELLDADMPLVHARTDELKEVMLNLLENARNALAGSGTIVVALTRSGEDVELSVSDNGAGIPADLLPRIFEPHFSTRSTGTGLGLAIVRRLVESWGGAVSAESLEGEGTTVRVRMRVA